jgi:hypothetical protein
MTILGIFTVPRIAVTGTCDLLDWFSLIILTFIDTKTPFTRILKRESE